MTVSFLCYNNHRQGNLSRSPSSPLLFRICRRNMAPCCVYTAITSSFLERGFNSAGERRHESDCLPGFLTLAKCYLRYCLSKFISAQNWFIPRG